MDALRDSFGRRFAYLRISVTDACNFRCTYCLPDGYKKMHSAALLSLSEIKNLVEGFAEIGTRKVRLTGGEPTLRRDLFEIAATVSAVEGIEQVALSTNGHNLKDNAGRFQQNGISRINISIDTLDRERFSKITGVDRLPQIMAGIDECLSLGYKSVKVNAVLMRATGSDQIDAFQNWIKDRPVAVRFIELMRTSENGALFDRQHVSSEILIRRLRADGWESLERGAIDGPAIEWSHPDFKGKIGIIAPYAKDFCASCNRLRISSRAGLRLCLFGEGEHSLRHLIQDSSQRPEMQEFVRSLLFKKEISHYLPDGRVGDNRSFSMIGG